MASRPHGIADTMMSLVELGDVLRDLGQHLLADRFKDEGAACGTRMHTAWLNVQSRPPASGDACTRWRTLEAANVRVRLEDLTGAPLFQRALDPTVRPVHSSDTRQSRSAASSSAAHAATPLRPSS